MTPTEECAKCGTVGPVDVACRGCAPQPITRAHKLEAKRHGREWAERREREVHDVNDPRNAIFDSSWVDPHLTREDERYLSYLVSAAAAHWWGKRRAQEAGR